MFRDRRLVPDDLDEFVDYHSGQDQFVSLLGEHSIAQLTQFGQLHHSERVCLQRGR